METFAVADLLSALSFSYSYNSTLVSISLMVQGIVTALIGALLLFRGKSLLADALSHATLPGVAAGFLFSYFFLGDIRYEAIIVIGALLAMLIALLAIQLASSYMEEDTAFALCLSGFYALGIVLLSYIQNLPSGSKANLEQFILGQSATINLLEAQIILVVSVFVLSVYFCFAKEWKLLCFDPSYAQTQGYKTKLLDFLITFLACVVISIGIRSTGLILIIGLISIPSLAASLIAKRWMSFVFITIGIGGSAAHIGASLSSSMDGVPTGSAIIICCMLFYFLALLVRAAKPVWLRTTTRPILDA